jgi:hypothetical protein
LFCGERVDDDVGHDSCLVVRYVGTIIICSVTQELFFVDIEVFLSNNVAQEWQCSFPGQSAAETER